MIMACRYNSYSSSLVRRYGYRIYRVGIDAGFTCPNRISGRGGCVYCDSLGARAAYQRKNESGFGHDSSFVSDIDLIASSGDCSRKAATGQSISQRTCSPFPTPSPRSTA